MATKTALVRESSAGLHVYTARGRLLGLAQTARGAQRMAAKEGLVLDMEAGQLAPAETRAEAAARAWETRDALYDRSDAAKKAAATRKKNARAA